MSGAQDPRPRILVLGIGNVLMGDEGVGVRVALDVERRELPPNVSCLDGGTGSFTLLGPMQEAERLILIDATIDGLPPGTVRRLQPRFSRDYPRTLTAHDIGLKDLLDVFHLTDNAREVTLFAVSIAPYQEMGAELSGALAGEVPRIADRVFEEACVQAAASAIS